jgi:RND superfamily putative drug exporter
MAALARWCFRHRVAVVLSWLVALVLMGGLARSAGAAFSTNFSLPATDSSRAQALLKANFPAQAGDVEQIVFQSRSGTLDTPAVRVAVAGVLNRVAHLPDVKTVQSPYSGGVVSADRTIGLGTINFDSGVQNLPSGLGRSLLATAQSVDHSLIDVQLDGHLVGGSSQSGQTTSELLGIGLSLLVLFLAFRRSVYCALLPLLSALAAIGVGTSLIDLLTHAIPIPQFGPILATLVALGVGVDYALFIVSRHRAGLLAGHRIEDAVVMAINTSGRAVFFAGLTVCIALLGMFALQVSFLYGVALSAALVVALTMLASLTLLPAMLSFFGLRALRRGERRRLAEGPVMETTTGLWTRWSKVLQGRSRTASALALVFIVVVAFPFVTMRQGLSDAGNDASHSTTRQAYDLLAKGFGPGYNGPFELVGDVRGPADAARFASFATSLKAMPGVVSVQPARVSPNGQVEMALLYPASSPQSAQTADLLQRVRSQVPKAVAGSTLAIHVGGPTAGQVDFAHTLSRKMPQFVAVVVVLAFLLLLILFRSLLVPLIASMMNLLSIGAALGVLTAAFQWGWGKPLLGYTKAGPIEVFLPVMLFAILFGLSMDYEVFLVSRMHEEWVLTGDNDAAVARGQEATGRVITAAATIMILVFVSFIFGGQLVIKEFGLGFSAAIFMDAFVIRTVLVPAVMHVLGSANWWLPRWLDRILPRLHVEADDFVPADLGPVPEPVPATN